MRAWSRGSARRRARVAVLAIAVVLVPACQLAEETGPIRVDATGAAEDQAAALGSPEEDWPGTLDELQAYAAPEALAWQDEPVLADVTVWLRPDRRWDRVRLTYVAPAADRMLVLRADPDGLEVQRPRLAGLQLLDLPREATDQMSPLPEGVQEPVDLGAASAQAIRDCGGDPGQVAAVLYATGAPTSWDGQEWTRLPSWQATVLTPEVGVVVDPSTGEAFAPLTCVEPLLLDS